MMSGSMAVIYKDRAPRLQGRGRLLLAGPAQLQVEEGAEIIQFSGAGGLAEQAAEIEELIGKMASGAAVGVTNRRRTVQ